MADRRRLRAGGDRLWGLLAVAAALIAYFPIIRGYFFADDFYNFVQAADAPPARFLLSGMAGHVLVARNLVISVFFRLFGIASTPYFVSVLLTHLLNVWLLFRVLRLQTDLPVAAGVLAGLWGASPLHVETLSWYAVFGQVLVGTALLVLLHRLSRETGTLEPRAAAGLCGMLLVGSTCFGVGLGVATVAPVVALILRPASLRRWGARAWLLALPVVTVAGYAGLRAFAPARDAIGVLLLGPPDVEQGTRIGTMLANLLARGLSGLVLGPFLPAPGGGAFAAWVVPTVVGVGLLAAATTGGSPLRRKLVAHSLLALAVYGVIAVGRARWYAIVSGDISIAASASRYHYVGSIPLAGLLCLLLAWVRQRISPLVGNLLLAGLAMTQVGGLPVWGLALDLHAPIRAYVEQTVRQIDAAVDRAAPGARAYVPNEAPPKFVLGVFSKVHFPGPAAVFVLTHRDDSLRGRRVVFGEANWMVRTSYREPQSRRLSHLLVQPTVTPGGDGALRTDPPCELELAGHLETLARGLLGCERRGRSAGTSAAACSATVVRRYSGRTARTPGVRPCRACDGAGRAGLRVQEAGRLAAQILRCPQPSRDGEAQARCDGVLIHEVSRLLRALFACHDRSAVEAGVLEDAACEARAEAAYAAALTAAGPACQHCPPPKFVTALTRSVVVGVYNDIFCLAD